MKTNDYVQWKAALSLVPRPLTPSPPCPLVAVLFYVVFGHTVSWLWSCFSFTSVHLSLIITWFIWKFIAAQRRLATKNKDWRTAACASCRDSFTTPFPGQCVRSLRIRTLCLWCQSHVWFVIESWNFPRQINWNGPKSSRVQCDYLD